MFRSLYKVKVKSVFILLLLMFFNLQAQNIDNLFFGHPKLLNYNNELPKDFLSTRTAVFISTPSGNISKGQKDWKAIGVDAHKEFRKIGIDAVAYYHLEDVFSGIDASKAFAEDLKKRNIKNIILLANEGTPNRPDSKATLIITPFNGDHNFIAHNQSAWKSDDSKLEKVLDDLYKFVSRLDYEKSNYLIIDQPEYFEDTRINKGKRFETFHSDLKLDKLAVPKFEEADPPDLKPEGTLNNQVQQSLTNNKEEAIANNHRLEGIMAAYPYKYELVDPNKSEDNLRKEGFQYILLRLHTSDITIKNLLNYLPDKPGASSLKSVTPRTEPVYKYYIKHIYSGDIYLGTDWDAASTWQEALEIHIQNMRRELKVN